MLDAEMQLQRAWLELSLREFAADTRATGWARFNPLKIGMLGLSFLKHRSLWLAAISMLVSFYRRSSPKEKS
jgi:hypothetical protein